MLHITISIISINSTKSINKMISKR